ncbi:MAG: sigma-70 family RNA polymerase sigma factor [Candidatus Marinimicrobia bacterium]|nr:sigma-70 family RNA polymerase sigma factor [Candidatus Neomarinimicrobiota bacterium]
MEPDQLKKYRQGDHEYFRQIMDELQKPIYYFLYRYVGNAGDAEDLTQETFVKAYTERDKFRGDSQISTWIYRIATNLAKNHIRWRSIRNFLTLDALQGSLVEEPESEVEREHREHEIMNHLQHLPKTQRSVFILKYFNELSHQEISDILGISLSSSKTNFHYAVKSLKKTISGDSK